MSTVLRLFVMGLLLAACDVNGSLTSKSANDAPASLERLAENGQLHPRATAGATTALSAEQQRLLDASRAISDGVTFSQVDDFNVQYNELVDYLDRANLPIQITQVDLKTHRKISQYYDIDSSLAGYGKNACGLVAAAAAMGGDNWQPLIAVIALAAGDHYQATSGIQPSNFVAALGQALITTTVRAQDAGSLGQLYLELAAGNIVIVDVKLNDAQGVPSASPPNLAHFARVLGLDVDRQVIYLENTVGGDAYWAVTLTDFWATWQHPETSASLILDPRHVEDVTRWAVVISGELVMAKRSR